MQPAMLTRRAGSKQTPIPEWFEAENAEVEGAGAVARALDWHRLGADFADSMHLASCGDAVMHTFDHGFCKAARDGGLAPEIRVLQA